MSCGRRRAESCPARLLLVGWATPRGAAHVVGHGYLGLYTPQPPKEHSTPPQAQGLLSGIDIRDIRRKEVNSHEH